jgi:hypothetical protein
MNKYSKHWKTAIILPLSAGFLIVALVGQALPFLFGENYRYSPKHFSTYTYHQSGYYEIDPETILGLLDEGKTKVLTPYFGDLDRDEPYYDDIAWLESDFLKVANAISLEAWNEPLDLENWQLIGLDFEGDCEDDPRGFHSFQIVYYRDLGIENFERHYETRLIEMILWQGLIRWGGDVTYSVPLLLWWKGIDRNQFRITAEDALEVAEKRGGSDMRLRVDNSCRILVSATNGDDVFPPYQSDKWRVGYDGANYHLYINPFTGRPKIRIFEPQ